MLSLARNYRRILGTRMTRRTFKSRLGSNGVYKTADIPDNTALEALHTNYGDPVDVVTRLRRGINIIHAAVTPPAGLTLLLPARIIGPLAGASPRFIPNHPVRIQKLDVLISFALSKSIRDYEHHDARHSRAARACTRSSAGSASSSGPWSRRRTQRDGAALCQHCRCEHSLAVGKRDPRSGAIHWW